MLEASAGARATWRLFFDPVRQRVPGHAEDAADAAPTRTFLRRSEDVFPAFRAIGLFWGQDPTRATVFAQIVRTAALLSSIFHQVCTAAYATRMLTRGADHLTIFFEDDFFDQKIHLKKLDHRVSRSYRARVFARLDRIETGNLGDCKSVGEGVCELRLHFGAGYRIYFGEIDSMLIVLLCGGEKSSQEKEIQRAKAYYWKHYKNTR